MEGSQTPQPSKRSRSSVAEDLPRRERPARSGGEERTAGSGDPRARAGGSGPESGRRASSLLFTAGSAAALLLVLAAYSNSLDNSFHFDDSHVIEENIFIRDLRNVPRFFTDARTFSCLPTNATYRPIVSITLALDYWLGRGLIPRAFHVTQILLLVVTGVMLAALFFKILSSTGPSPWHRWSALVAATLFCIHTGNTQPVNYISARSELLSGIGVLGALLVYACLPRARRFQMHLIPMVFGALAKTPAVIVAPLLLAYALLIEKQLSLREVFSRRAWPRVKGALTSTAPAFLVAVALYLFVEAMNPPGQTYGGGGRLRYLMTETWVWVHYGRMFLAPFGLSADTDLELFSSPWDARVAVGVLFATVMLFMMWAGSQRVATRAAAFGIAWFAIALIPSSTIFPLAEVANDHRVFLPFMGLSLAAVAWLFRRFELGAAERGRTTAAWVTACLLAVAVLGAHAVGTYRRNRIWRTEETLWADVVRKSPANGRGMMNYGLTQMVQGRYERAKELFVQAQKLLPNYSTLQVNLGIVENGLGNPAAAESHFTRALALNPAHPATHRYYARWLIGQGRGAEAIPHLERTLELSPGDIEARHQLMSLHAARAAPELVPLALETLNLAAGDTIAARYAKGGLPFRPDSPGAGSWFKLAVTFRGEKRHTDAAQAYRAALALDSSNADAWNNLGWSLAKLGFYQDAIPAFRSAERHQPGFALASNNLAWAVEEVSTADFKRAFALQQTGRPSESVAIYRTLLTRYPKWVNVHYNLGHALIALGRHAEAIAEFRRVLELQPGFTAVHLHLATCLKALGRAADAKRELERYLRAGNSGQAEGNAAAFRE